MGLFGPKPLPTTSYGYQPPTSATVHGWVCSNWGCGRSEHEPVRRWPKVCTECGSQADPLFDQPWEHDATGAEYQHKIRTGRQGYDLLWLGWQLKDALLHCDAPRVAAVRAESKAFAASRLEYGVWGGAGYLFHSFVWDSLEAGDLNGAADDLAYWVSISTAKNAETDNTNRTNCRQVIDMASRFLNAPGGSAHPLAGHIRQGCLKLAEGAWPILNPQLQGAVTQMARG